MQAISEYNVSWTEQPWGRTAQLASTALWQEVAPHQSFAPEKLGSGQELITITLAGGAQVRVGERVLRPLAGQILQRESGEELEIVNDTLQPVRLLRVTLA
ncbi:MAG: hypothetical protein KF760_17145 [Candidatus Eremiobacteraeota bacterium]|nr:hypothetical protein [Candidatus Eremiobacteraeota bacterium]MCW5869029.1 hypothetical protein [Candidatus Eremiobacteraeota bacterium]